MENDVTLPKHVAIIMDGNGRWAKKRGLPRTFGHKVGTENVRKIVKYCSKKGIEYLTVYAFSTENFKRPQEEVSTLMKLLVEYFNKETDELRENGVRLNVIGDTSSFAPVVREAIENGIKKTENCKGSWRQKFRKIRFIHYFSSTDKSCTARMDKSKYFIGCIARGSFEAATFTATWVSLYGSI